MLPANPSVNVNQQSSAPTRRLRTLSLTCFQVQTPTIWLGHDLKQGVRVWDFLHHCPGLLLNAYHLLKVKPRVRERIAEFGVQKVLGFRGPLFIDSGGFLFRNDKYCRMSPKELLALYHEIQPDLAAVLDLPLNPLASDGVNRRRWRKTLQNTEFMHRNNGSVQLCPILHAYSSSTAERRCGELKEALPQPKVICVGSLVPLLQGRYIGDRFRKSRSTESPMLTRWRLIAKLILQVRKCYPDTVLHVFGVGSLSTMYLLYLLGIDSVDSVSWRIKAAFGEIQLPGLPNRCVSGICTGVHTRRKLSREDYGLLIQCNCHSCESLSLSQRINNLRCSYAARAVHNASVLISEVVHARGALRQNRLEKFVTQRLQRSPLYARILEAVVLPEIGSDANRDLLHGGH